MVPYLPFEVMTRILERLPVRTLLRFRVVCKLCCSLISSDQFVRRHLSLCSNNTQRIIMNPSGLLYDLGFYSVNDSIVLDETSIDIRIGSHNRFCVMGSCNGLICLKGVTGTMLLWNQSTRDLKMLPSTSQVGVVNSGTSQGVLRKYGFGYDYYSDDYKVLTLLSNRTSEALQSIIHTLRSNSWRRIQHSLLGIFFSRTTGAHAHSSFSCGALHWKAEKSGRIGGIVSFDLTSETYKEVPLPHHDIQSYQLEVGASRDAQAPCLLTDEDVDGGCYNIWVMKEYGVQESWIKTIEIPRHWSTVWHCIIRPMTWFVENGEILLYADGDPVSYNANKNSLVYFARDDKFKTFYPNSVGYVESLVSPNAYNNLGANKCRRGNTKIVLKDSE